MKKLSQNISLAAFAMYVIIALLAIFNLFYWLSHDLNAIEKIVALRFSQVDAIKPKSLKQGLEKSHNPGSKPLMIDVREQVEFNVSHIPGAIHMPSSDPMAITKVAQLLSQKEASTPAVFYCSIGWRSSQMVEALKQLGFKNVYNLEGSLFRWARLGYPLVSGDKTPTTLVHPYDGAWQGLLQDSTPVSYGS